MESIVIVGGGLVGNLLAIMLAQAKYPVTVYEEREDPRVVAPKSDRSTSITITERGFHALNTVGMGDAVRERTIPIYGRMIHDEQGKTTYQPYGAHGKANYALRRADLHRILLTAAEQHPEVRVHFQKKCVGVDLATHTLRFRDPHHDRPHEVSASLVFGADGAFSAIRRSLQQEKGFDYSQQYLRHGYREITLLPNVDGSPLFDRNAFHIWPRDEVALYGFANLDGTFTLSLLMPHDGPLSNAALTTESQLRDLFRSHFPDVLPFLGRVVGDYLSNPFQWLVTIKCFPWVYQDKMALVGDAAHAIFPFYGQGANAGFEDCEVLMGLLKEHRGDWAATLRDYQQQRKPNTDAIADLCFEHFIELMERVKEPQFQLRKKIEHTVETLAPDRPSLYYNISFSTMPYAKAVALEQQHQRLIDQLLQVEDIEAKLSDPHGRQWIKDVFLSSEH